MNKYFISTKKNNPNLLVLRAKVLKNKNYRYKTVFWLRRQPSEFRACQASMSTWLGIWNMWTQCVPVAQSFGSEMEDIEIEFPEACGAAGLLFVVMYHKESPWSKQGG